MSKIEEIKAKREEIREIQALRRYEMVKCEFDERFFALAEDLRGRGKLFSLRNAEVIYDAKENTFVIWKGYKLLVSCDLEGGNIPEQHRFFPEKK